MNQPIYEEHLNSLRAAVARLKELEAHERISGKATFEQIALEDSFGDWRELLEAIADAKVEDLTH